MKFWSSKKIYIGVTLLFILLMSLLSIWYFWKKEQNKLESENYIEVINGVEFEMIRVDGGIFKMGCSDKKSEACDNDELPEHVVKVNSFYISKYEVTQAQWRAIMLDYPSYYGECLDCPVECVSWEDVQVFIKRLNRRSSLNYRLPTEAEWEFAARGGRKSKNYIYSGGDNIDSLAWYWKNSNERTHPVGQKKPNELGIYDMSGNVWEWCSDWYGEYENRFCIKPIGPVLGYDRVLRGGCIDGSSKSCRCAKRAFNAPNFPNVNNGFRLVMDPHY